MIPANKWWQDEGRTSQRYVLNPCSGFESLQRGHVYSVQDCDGQKAKNLGYMTEKTAAKKYGGKNIFISGSDALCPRCRKKLMATI